MLTVNITKTKKKKTRKKPHKVTYISYCLCDILNKSTLFAPNCTLALPLTKVALICMMTDSIE